MQVSSRSEWYVLQTKARQEFIAQKNLACQNFNTFVPLIRQQKRLGGQSKCVSEPLFASYIFIELDLENQNTAMLRSTRGVVSLVRFGTILQPFPRDILNALMEVKNNVGDTIFPVDALRCGDEIEVLGGPMAGLKGIFDARDSMERVVVLLNILGAKTQVNVSSKNISKVC